MKIGKEHIRTSGITIAVTFMLLTVCMAIFIAFSNTSTKIHGANYAEFSAALPQDGTVFEVRLFGDTYEVDYSQLASMAEEGLQDYSLFIPREVRAGMQLFQIIRDNFFESS